MRKTDNLKKALLIIGAVGGLGLNGCAHQQVAKISNAAAPAPLASKRADTKPEMTQQEKDLQSLLSGTVIHFDLDQDELSSTSKERLNQLADALRSYQQAHIKVFGNCDERGTEEYNLALGQRRAEVAKQYLTALGIKASRIDTVSYGNEKPLDTRHTEAAWANNRRDEFTTPSEVPDL